jgi:flagellin
LNGSLDYATSGVDGSALANVAVRGALFGTQSYIPISVDVTTSAQTANLYYRSGTITDDINIEVRGNDGVVTLPFGAGTAASAIVAGINSVSDATGVVATLSSNPTAGFTLSSAGYGTRSFVEITTLPGSGTFTLEDDSGNPQTKDEGRDAVAGINGTQAIADGLLLTLKAGNLDLELALDESFGAGTTSFAITGGGSLFQLGGHVNSNEQVSLGIQSVAASRLGDSQIGFLSQIVTGEAYDLSTEAGRTQASKIVDEATRQISLLRGRLGAFEKNTLDTNINQLGITMENLMSAESSIRDADFAYETSQLTRNQILVSAGTSVLGLSNQTPQTVLSLLGG